MKKKQILALCTALTLGLTACGAKTGKTGAEETAQAGVAVQTTTVLRESMATDNKVSGRISAEDEAVIMIGVAAKCTAVYAEAGEEVRKGDVLCTLDLGSTLSQYNAARISYDSAVQNYNDQKGLLDQQVDMAEKQLAMAEEQIGLTRRQIELMGPQIELAGKNVRDTLELTKIGAASQMEYDNAQIQYDQALFQLDQAKLQVEQLELQRDSSQVQLQQLKSTRSSTLAQLEAGIQNARSGVQQLDNVLEDVDAKGNVIAPMSGTLVTFNATENNYISNTMPLAVIDGEAQMKLTVSVSEALVPKLMAGDEADVYVSALDRTLNAVIRSVERSANVQTRLYTVTLALPEDTEGVLAGMSADVTFHTDRVSDTIAIPSQAILNSGDKQFVYVVEGEKAKYVEVTTGLTGAGVTQVLTGLTGGEKLVTVGQSYLSDGDAVRVVAEE